jgi:hypothetical protein
LLAFAKTLLGGRRKKNEMEGSCELIGRTQKRTIDIVAVVS